MEPSRRSTLLGVKLKALVTQHTGVEVSADPETVLDGAALLHGDAAWVLLDGDASCSLGSALVWAVRRGARSVDVIAESGGGVLARRAARFSLPISIWFPEARALLPTVAEPLTAPPEPTPEHLAMRELILEGGAVPNVEHGVVSGEVRGLQVCRVVDRPTVGFVTEVGDLPAFTADQADGVRLEVGVGDADREAFQLLHGDLPTREALASVVDAVIRHRSDEAPQHPLNRLGRERYLRWRAEQDPGSVGLVALRATEPPLPRPNLKDPVPCVGVGSDQNARQVRVVFSCGVDLDLVPFVADVQTMGAGPVRIAVPARDAIPVQREVAALLAEPVEVVTVE